VPLDEETEQMCNPDDAKDGAREDEICLHQRKSCQGAGSSRHAPDRISCGAARESGLMLPPKELYLVECGLIWIVNQATKSCVYQDPVVQVRPLLLGVRMKKDAVVDAGNDYPLVPHIDSDDVSNMNRLAVVVAHA
jgi:hypothetical protein